MYLKLEKILMADVFEKFVKISTLEHGINLSCSYSLQGYTWKSGLKLTKVIFDFIGDEHLLLLIENKIRVGN